MEITSLKLPCALFLKKIVILRLCQVANNLPLQLVKRDRKEPPALTTCREKMLNPIC